jgi:uncharacterized RDD family membrane protein YckC
VYCSKCGSEISATAAFCAQCGQAVSGLVALASAPMAPVPQTYPVAAPAQAYGGVFYAGFWLRFVAYLIDGVISSVAFVILLIALVVLTGAGAGLSKLGSPDDLGDELAAFLGLGFFFGVIALILGVRWLYYAFSECSSWQGTVGKRLLNLYVADTSGQAISFGRASGRFFAKIITSMIPLGIGYILAGCTEKKQALHDMIASCLVLRRG